MTAITKQDVNDFLYEISYIDNNMGLKGQLRIWIQLNFRKVIDLNPLQQMNAIASFVRTFFECLSEARKETKEAFEKVNNMNMEWYEEVSKDEYEEKEGIE